MKSILGQLQNSTRLHISSLFLLVFIIAAPTFQWTFRGDEYPLIRRVDNMMNQSGVVTIVTTTQRGFQEGEYGWDKYAYNTDAYRPILEIIFAFERATYGLWYPGYRLTNTLLVFFSALLVYRISLEFFASGPRAFIASLLFTTSFTHLHPFVGMISNRTDSLAGFFFILTLFLFVRYRHSESKQGHLLVLTGVTLAVFSKETAVGLPIVLVIYDLLFTRPLRWSVFSVHAFTFGLLGLYIVARFLLFGGMGATPIPSDLSLGRMILNLMEALPSGLLPWRGLWSEATFYVLPLVGVAIYFMWSEAHPDRRRTQRWIFCIISYYLAAGTFLLLGGGDRFLYASTAFLWIWLADVLVMLLRPCQLPGIVARLARPMIAIVVIFVALAVGFKELYSGIRDGSEAAFVAGNLLEGLATAVPEPERGSKFIFVTVPAACGTQGVFYNGLSDAIALRYGRGVESFILSEFSSERCDESHAMSITRPTANTFRVSIAHDQPVELILSQTDLSRLAVGESLTNRYSRVTLEEASSVPVYDKLGMLWARQKVHSVSIEVNPQATNAPNQYYFYYYGHQLWQLAGSEWVPVSVSARSTLRVPWDSMWELSLQ